MTKIYLTLLICVISQSSLSQNAIDSIGSKLNTYYSEYPQEKIFVHLNRPHYRIGQTVWFKTYLLNASTHVPTKKSDVIRVELVDPSGEIVSQRLIKTTDGNGHGDFVIKSTFEPGYYTIRAYTNWMRNFGSEQYFNTSFSVYPIEGLVRFRNQGNAENKIEIGFFPEGGEWLSGIASKLGIKAIDASGSGIQLTGIIADRDGEKVSSFQTNDLGFGSIDITPAEGEVYRALISTSESEESFDLPKPQNSGASIKVLHSFDSPNISIKISSKNQSLKNSSLVIHQRGQIIKSYKHQDDNSEFTFDLIKKDLTPGVFHATLFEESGFPIIERLFASNINVEQARGVIESQNAFRKGTRIVLDVSVKDLNENLLPSSLSLSVNQLSGIDYERSENIRNYLLLSSDLEGQIENPDFYFSNTQEAYNQLDLLMLTQGWKRFQWEDIVSGSPELKFKPEIGVRLSGTIVDFSNRSKPRQGIVSVSAGLESLYDVETDQNGRFELLGINLYDTVKLHFNAKRRVGKKGKFKDDVYIKVDKPSSPTFARERNWEASAEVFDQSEKELMDTAAYNLLDEVLIQTRKKVTKNKFDPFSQASERYGTPSDRIIADSLIENSAPRSIADFVRGVPGVAIGGAGSSQFIRFQGSSNSLRMYSAPQEVAEPLYLINGVPASESSVFNLNPYDISYIDLLRGTDASIFGVRGGNGVIAVYLRGLNGYRPPTESGVLAYMYPGYYKARSFTTSDYLGTLRLQKDPLGKAVHWEPMIKTSEKDLSKVTFEALDESANYVIKVEGITSDGTPIVNSKTVRVE